MSTWVNKRRKGRSAVIYLGVSAFCLIFAIIYNQFSHGIHSPYMSLLFAWPLLLGFVPGMAKWCLPKVREAGFLSANLYHFGVAAVTVSSLLRGIFEIAGTSSNYQTILMYAGGVMILGGVICYLAGK